LTRRATCWRRAPPRCAYLASRRRSSTRTSSTYGGRGFSDGTHYICLAPRSDEFARRTAEIIVSWEIREDDSTDLDEDEGTSADFTLEVSDPRYLEHFTKNTYFQTAFTGHLPS
jgi:hypothetical protein